MTGISHRKPPVPLAAVGLAVSLDAGFEQLSRGAPGVMQKVLSGALDEEAVIGARTRPIRFLPERGPTTCSCTTAGKRSN